MTGAGLTSEVPEPEATGWVEAMGSLTAGSESDVGVGGPVRSMVEARGSLRASSVDDPEADPDVLCLFLFPWWAELYLPASAARCSARGGGVAREQRGGSGE